MGPVSCPPQPPDPRCAPRRPSAVDLAGLLACAAVAGAIAFYCRNFFHDDAYIGLRYVRNLLAGHGMGWNPGERVEGYTNFLHLVLTGGLGAVGMNLVLATRIVSAGAMAVLCAFVTRVSGLLTGVLILAAAPLIVWVLGGLEAPLFALLVTAGCWSARQALQQRQPRSALLAGLILGLATATRPDAVLFLAVGLAFLGAAALQEHADAAPGQEAPGSRTPAGGSCGHTRQAPGVAGAPIGEAPPSGPPPPSLPHVRGSRSQGTGLMAFAGALRQRPCAMALAAFAAGYGLVVLPYAVWKTLYYGELVPNTYYVKTGGLGIAAWIRGLRYLAGFTWRPPWWPVFGAAAAAVVLCRGPRRLDTVFVPAAVATYAGYVVFVGGDHMPGFRLLAPLVPLCVLYTLAVCRPLLSPLGPHLKSALWIAAAILLALQIPAYRLQRQPVDPAAVVGEVVGRYINKAWPAGTTIALNTAGSTPFHAPDHTYIDMLGLNDRHIARRMVGPTVLRWQHVPGHRKGDGAYVLGRKPDYIILGPAEGTDPGDPYFLSDLELARDPRFARLYHRCQVHLDASAVPGALRCGAVHDGMITFTYYRRMDDEARQGNSPVAEPQAGISSARTPPVR